MRIRATIAQCRTEWRRQPAMVVLFIKSKTNADELVNKMKTQKRILIKSYPNVGYLGDCIRVSIGAKQYMETFVNALLELDR